MKDQLDKVKHFHEIFRGYIEYTPTAKVDSDEL